MTVSIWLYYSISWYDIWVIWGLFSPGSKKFERVESAFSMQCWVLGLGCYQTLNHYLKIYHGVPRQITGEPLGAATRPRKVLEPGLSARVFGELSPLPRKRGLLLTQWQERVLAEHGPCSVSCGFTVP